MYVDLAVPLDVAEEELACGGHRLECVNLHSRRNAQIHEASEIDAFKGANVHDCCCAAWQQPFVRSVEEALCIATRAVECF